MTSLQLISLLMYLAILAISIKKVIPQILTNKIQHLVFGTATAVFTLWWFKTGIYPGLEIHFMWLTALTLMLGWRWAYISAFIALVLQAILGFIQWHDLGILGLLTTVLPITFTYLAYTFAFKHLPRHFFVYTFFCSFFIGAMSIALKMFVMSSYLYFTGEQTWTVLVDNYLILIPLLLFPEGLLNGMTMTILIVYKPEWVKTFYDSQYIDGK